MKFLPVAAELFRADGRKDRQTDRQTTKLIVAFRNFANVYNKETDSAVTRTHAS